MKHQASSWGGPAHNQAPDFFQKKNKKATSVKHQAGWARPFSSPHKTFSIYTTTIPSHLPSI